MSACVTMMRREALLSDQSPPSPQIRAKTRGGAAHNSGRVALSRDVAAGAECGVSSPQPGIDNNITGDHALEALPKSGLKCPELVS